MNANKTVIAPALAALPLFQSMTREELRAVAKLAGVKTGKSSKDTVNNLMAAVEAGKLNLKAVCTLSFKDVANQPDSMRINYYGKTLRTYVSGPGLGNDVWMTPPVAAVPGHPTDPCGS